MTLNEYQSKADTTAIYPPDKGLEYCIFGLIGEAGEIANKYKKYLRGDKTLEDINKELPGELGDVLWYVAMLAMELGYDLEEIGQLNLEKLAKRKQEQKLKGEGDNR